MEAMDGSEESMRQTRLKGTKEKENERPQMNYVLEKRSTNETHSKVGPSAYKEEGGEMTICQIIILKRWVPTLETSSFDRP